MAAYFIAQIQIPDQNSREQYDEYIEKVKPIVEQKGGTYIVRSEKVTPFLDSNAAPDRVIIIQFPSRKILEQCFSSSEYQSIKMLRENSVQSIVYIVED